MPFWLGQGHICPGALPAFSCGVPATYPPSNSHQLSGTMAWEAWLRLACVLTLVTATLGLTGVASTNFLSPLYPNPTPPPTSISPCPSLPSLSPLFSAAWWLFSLPYPLRPPYLLLSILCRRPLHTHFLSFSSLPFYIPSLSLPSLLSLYYCHCYHPPTAYYILLVSCTFV